MRARSSRGRPSRPLSIHLLPFVSLERSDRVGWVGIDHVDWHVRLPLYSIAFHNVTVADLRWVAVGRGTSAGYAEAALPCPGGLVRFDLGEGRSMMSRHPRHRQTALDAPLFSCRLDARALTLASLFVVEAVPVREVLWCTSPMAQSRRKRCARIVGSHRRRCVHAVPNATAVRKP
jgi:hypothetical protein